MHPYILIYSAVTNWTTSFFSKIVATLFAIDDISTNSMIYNSTTLSGTTFDKKSLLSYILFSNVTSTSNAFYQTLAAGVYTSTVSLIQFAWCGLRSFLLLTVLSALATKLGIRHMRNGDEDGILITQELRNDMNIVAALWAENKFDMTVEKLLDISLKQLGMILRVAVLYGLLPMLLLGYVYACSQDNSFDVSLSSLYNSLEITSALVIAYYILQLLLRPLKMSFLVLHNNIRDANYLIGRTLVNIKVISLLYL